MKVGMICYATWQGLGVLARSFYDHGIVNEVFIIEHSRHPTQWEWYPDTSPHCPIRDLDQKRTRLQQWAESLDVLVCFETPFYWPIVDYAKSRGVKTVMMPMYECSLQNPPATFDEYWCPSLLDLQYFSSGAVDSDVPWFSACQGINQTISRFTPVPVDVEWKQRTEARVFVHNAGHGGLKGRNGTAELLDAIQFVKSPIKLIVRSQESIRPYIDERIELRFGTFPQESLYSEGDVFIFPEKFNGLSLPLQEARAAGMLVMATNRFPINTWLPTSVEDTEFDGSMSFVPFVRDPLIPTSGTVKNRIGPPYMEFDEAVIDPRDIAAKIDEWYGRDITQYSLLGKEWAESMSWEKLGPRYKTLLETLR